MATGGQLVAGLCMCWDRYQEDEDTQKQETAQTDPNFTVEIDSSNATFRCFGKCRATMLSAFSAFLVKLRQASRYFLALPRSVLMSYLSLLH